ncbi:MAG: SUMF1/EgtB/PvdO family nonheme iron enzyme [Hyphomicrobiaceae bacterium]|nr:SUMF1/EgtB/PvdO family nonheme iron enzyme [Hyphomicrobiaceae bacterium]
MRAILVLIAGLLLACAIPATAADRRVALVIGNGAYKHTPVLANPKNDAADMKAALAGLGFEVIEGIDLDKAGMDRTIRTFARALAGAKVGALFYAGHGLQVGGVNYLVPVDAELTTADALDFEMIRLDVVQRVMEAATETNVIFLDACRDNPLSRNLARALGTRSGSIGRGLAQVEAGIGTLISYATQPGNVALDGEGSRNSPYTTALKKHVATAGEDLVSILIRVRKDVAEATKRKQIPWDQSALMARLVFKEAPAKPAELPPPARDTAALAPVCERRWSQVAATRSVAELRAFLNACGNEDPFHAELALLRIRELEKAAASSGTPPHPNPLPQGERDTRPTATSPLGIATPPSPSPLGGEGRGEGQQKFGQGPQKARSTPQPGDTFRDCPTCPEMVVVPAGSFIMGSPESEAGHSQDEGPQREVTIARPFAVGKYEVTFAEWDACVADDGCRQKPEALFGRGRQPVIKVSWEDARQYVAWLSATTAESYRLLSEAEWEYAARAGTMTPFFTGATITTEQANFDGNYTYGSSAKGTFRKKTTDVGTFTPNAFGLHDMHGNVWEWVEDCWHFGYRRAPSDGSPWSIECKDGRRMVRGGSGLDHPQLLRSASRVGYATHIRGDALGFRVARTLTP